MCYLHFTSPVGHLETQGGRGDRRGKEGVRGTERGERKEGRRNWYRERNRKGGLEGIQE